MGGVFLVVVGVGSSNTRRSGQGKGQAKKRKKEIFCFCPKIYGFLRNKLTGGRGDKGGLGGVLNRLICHIPKEF